MRFWKRLVTENIQPPVLIGVPGLPAGRELVGSPVSRGGSLFIIVPYEYPRHVDARSEGAMKRLCTVGASVAA